MSASPAHGCHLDPESYRRCHEALLEAAVTRLRLLLHCSLVFSVYSRYFIWVVGV